MLAWAQLASGRPTTTQYNDNTQDSPGPRDTRSCWMVGLRSLRELGPPYGCGCC